MNIMEYLDDLLTQLNNSRKSIIELNKIQYPQYDPYVNGWDDCIDLCENIVELIKNKISGQEETK